MTANPTVFFVLDTGLAQAYLFETDLLDRILEKGVRPVVLVQKALVPLLQAKYGREGVVFESLRDDRARAYQRGYWAGVQELFEHVRRATASPRIPLTYVDSHRRRKETEATGRRRWVLWGLRPAIYALRRVRPLRMAFRRLQAALFTPDLYGDLLDRYQPALIVSNTAGWRLDQYLLRQAGRRGIPLMLAVVGWDNPSSQGLPGAFVRYANVWSEVHRRELTAGVDWLPEGVHVGGMPLYDSYLDGRWHMTREAYFALHGLDPQRRLISFAATALSVTPNAHLVRVLTDLVEQDAFSQPAQLLIRLHPNHFKDFPHYREDAQEIYAIAARSPHVHIVEPREMPGGLERYSGEDYPEKASMLKHSDVLVTIYSTMVVEAALHDTPFVSACLESPRGWADKGKFWVPLREIPTWPTAARVNALGAGRTVFTPGELRDAIETYLTDPQRDAENRRRFIAQELTWLNGEATEKTAEFIRQVAMGEWQ